MNNANNNSDVSKTQVGQFISNAMQQKGVSIRDLAEGIDVTYEHVRRIVKGAAVPSKFILKLIADNLKLNSKELDRYATADRITKKFGSIPVELSGKNPELTPVEHVWGELTEDQKSAAVNMLQGWARLNRAHK
jgi:transcriptional regulator with XRE-family HTH domain